MLSRDPIVRGAWACAGSAVVRASLGFPHQRAKVEVETFDYTSMAVRIVAAARYLTLTERDGRKDASLELHVSRMCEAIPWRSAEESKSGIDLALALLQRDWPSVVCLAGVLFLRRDLSAKDVARTLKKVRPIPALAPLRTADLPRESAPSHQLFSLSKGAQRWPI